VGGRAVKEMEDLPIGKSSPTNEGQARELAKIEDTEELAIHPTPSSCPSKYGAATSVGTTIGRVKRSRRR
jgi:hypothetical protein